MDRSEEMPTFEGDPGVVLMLRYQGGDEAAFDALVEQYSGPVFALLTRFLGPVHGREDLVQDVFLRVIRARERYRATARFSTWLYRITYNLCVNQRLREGHRAALSLDAATGPDGERPGREVADANTPAPGDGLDRLDVVEAVRRAIDELPESQRMALLLAKYDGLPYAEIADVLDSSEKAIKSLIHRARESLRARLRPFLVEEPA